MPENNTSSVAPWTSLEGDNLALLDTATDASTKSGKKVNVFIPSNIEGTDGYEFYKEYEKALPELERIYGKGNVNLIPLSDASPDWKQATTDYQNATHGTPEYYAAADRLQNMNLFAQESRAKYIGETIQGFGKDDDVIVLDHNTSKLGGVWISEGIKQRFGYKHSEEEDTWSELFEGNVPEEYTGTCYFGSCSMADPERNIRLGSDGESDGGEEKSYSQFFTEESGVESVGQYGSWAGFKSYKGKNPYGQEPTLEEIMYDPYNYSEVGGQYTTYTVDPETGEIINTPIGE